MKKSSLKSVLALVVLASFLAVPVMADDFGGPSGGSFVISAQSTEELDPAIAYNLQQREYLVVFWNDLPGDDSIRAERVSWTGGLLGGFWVEAGVGHDRRYPDVAYNDRTNQYLVVWEDYVQVTGETAIRGRLISATGQLVADKVIRAGAVNTTVSRPAVAYAYTADKYLVVWSEAVTVDPTTTYTNIEGQVVNSDGSLSGSRFTIEQDAGGIPRRRPDVAYNRRRNDYLVVWESRSGDMGTNYEIYARLVTTDGSPSTTLIALAYSTYDDQRTPRVAALPSATADGAYLVAWQKQSATAASVVMQLVGGQGAKLGAPRTDWSYSNAIPPDLSCAVAASETGGQWLVVVKPAIDLPADAQAYSIDLMESSGWRTLDSGPGADHVAAASGPYGDFLIAFDRPPLGTRDIYGQLWTNRNYLYLPLMVKNY